MCRVFSCVVGRGCLLLIPSSALFISISSVSYGITTLFHWVLVCTRFCLSPQRVESRFSPVRGSPVIKSRWSSKSDSLGIPGLFAGSPGWEAWCGVQNHHKVREILQYDWSPVCGLPTWRVWVFILLWFVLLLPARCSVSFVFGCGISFFFFLLLLLGSSVLLSMVVWKLVATLVSCFL